MCMKFRANKRHVMFIFPSGAQSPRYRQINLLKLVESMESLPHEVLRLKAPTFGGYDEVVDVYLQVKRDGVAAKQAQRFVTAHAAVSHVFNLDRYLGRAEHYRDLRISAFSGWSRAVA